MTAAAARPAPPDDMPARQSAEGDAGAAGGKVLSVRGAVVDIHFDDAALPPINSAITVAWDRPEILTLEVHSHVDPSTVRAIALQPTAGLARGTVVHPATIMTSLRDEWTRSPQRNPARRRWQSQPRSRRPQPRPSSAPWRHSVHHPPECEG